MSGRCSVSGCERESVARGWCGGHYDRWRRGGDVRADEPLPEERKAACAAALCDRKPFARGHCSRHYKQLQRRGELLPEPETRGCAVTSCPNPVATRGWCHSHYVRWYRTGDVQADRPLGGGSARLCWVGGCGRTTKARGLCPAHYKRLTENGDVGEDVPLRTVSGDGTLSHGYWKVPVPESERHLTNGERMVGEHRLVMARALNRALTADEVVHHKNGDRTDNRLENLELWSTAQPRGQRIEDKVDYAFAILKRYRPDVLARDLRSDAE